MILPEGNAGMDAYLVKHIDQLSDIQSARRWLEVTGAQLGRADCAWGVDTRRLLLLRNTSAITSTSPGSGSLTHRNTAASSTSSGATDVLPEVPAPARPLLARPPHTALPDPPTATQEENPPLPGACRVCRTDNGALRVLTGHHRPPAPRRTGGTWNRYAPGDHGQ